MPVTIIFKTSLPTGADAKALKKIKLCKANGVFLPLSPGDDAANEALLAQYNKARKFETKLFAECKEAAEGGLKAFIAIAKTYLSNKRCLLVFLFIVNARRPLKHRIPLDQLIALANEYDILKNLNEPARLWQQPKASGNGMRVVCSFGPVAHAAQLMVSKLLRLTYQPQPFQFANLHFSEKVQQAMTVIKEKGYAHVTEIDIKDFFPSFTEEALMKSLPLPKEAIRQIVLAKTASWGPHPLYIQYGHISSPPGIPQGSASSAAVADCCIANMPLETLKGNVMINHADNFFALSASSECDQSASKALSSGIAGLPGGDFHGKTVQAVTAKQGFQMLGCWVYMEKDGSLEADPTDANVKAFRKHTYRQRQRVYGRLTAANKAQSEKLRVMGLQDYLRFESMCYGWVQAFAFCGILVDFIKDHYEFDLNQLRYTFKITEAELKPLKDQSTDIPVEWYSGS